jgi:flagella basal body P-ring formation protein FlgA
MMILTALALAGLGGIAVELPSASTSKGLEISVAEVAKVTGEDAATVALVEAASLGYAPAPGYHRTLRADLIEASLRQSLPGVDIQVTGAPRCCVTPAVQVVKGIEIQAAAATKLRESLTGLDSEAKVTGPIVDLQVPTSDTAPRIVVPPFNQTTFPGIRTVPVQVWLDHQLYRTVHVSFQVTIWQRRAVLRRAINAGEPLHAGLFEIKRVAAGGAAGMNALSLEELGGAVALKSLAAGVAVSERDVHRQVVVHRGDHVTVRVVKGNVAVSDVGLAKVDGRLGERVTVILKSTGRELVGTVRGPQSIEVKIQ